MRSAGELQENKFRQRYLIVLGLLGYEERGLATVQALLEL